MPFHFLQDGNIMSDCVSLYELPRQKSIYLFFRRGEAFQLQITSFGIICAVLCTLLALVLCTADLAWVQK